MHLRKKGLSKKLKKGKKPAEVRKKRPPFKKNKSTKKKGFKKSTLFILKGAAETKKSRAEPFF